LTQAVGNAQKRPLEGHFECGAGLLIATECLGHSYDSRTTNQELSISLPTLKKEWQEGFLGPPTWTYRAFRDPKKNAEVSDDKFTWGVTVGFHDEPDGTQAPDFARVRRLRFETTITTTNLASDFFNARGDAVRELETWWAVLSSWISVFTRQDFVEIGKTRSGIRVGPIVTWSGNKDGYRVNATIDTSLPVVSDDVEILDQRTLSGCMRLAANGTQPPDPWLFVRDARSLVNARQYRRAVLDAGTAAELAMTELIDRKLTHLNLLEREKLLEKNRGLWELSGLMVQSNAGTRPDGLQKDLAEPRNRAAHDGAALNAAKANDAIAVASDLVEQLHPLQGLLA
jgi:hypothetical protein